MNIRIRDERLAVLNEWLESVDARKLWASQFIGDVKRGNRIAAYEVNNYVILIQCIDDGWEIYLPASKVNSTAAALEAAAAFCGIQKGENL